MVELREDMLEKLAEQGAGDLELSRLNLAERLIADYSKLRKEYNQLRSDYEELLREYEEMEKYTCLLYTSPSPRDRG